MKQIKYIVLCRNDHICWKLQNFYNSRQTMDLPQMMSASLFPFLVFTGALVFLTPIRKEVIVNLESTYSVKLTWLQK